MKSLLLPAASVAAFSLLLIWAGGPRPVSAGETTPWSGEYKILAPITHGDLTIFPVAAARVHDTAGFLTLDEGIRSGDVVVTEVGNLHGVMRRRPLPIDRTGGAQVNRLVLVNNSTRPLLLLAGEIVTGGKQDRVVGKDRIVAPESDPVDLTVFCVEPGRWVEKTGQFGAANKFMVQPSVRQKVMADANQQKVWDEVHTTQSAMAEVVASAPATGASGGIGSGVGSGRGAGGGGGDASAMRLRGMSSYAGVREDKDVQKQVDSIAEPMQKSYESVIKQLREQNAVGVVVAVKGHIIWADIFASNALLNKYWPKLLQSYAVEALTMPGKSEEVSSKEADSFLHNWEAQHEVVDSEPGLYRQRELTGNRFKAFQLTSLLPKLSYDVHLSKMAE